MKKITKKTIIGLMLVPVLALSVAFVAPVADSALAATGGIIDGANQARGDDQPADLFAADGVFTIVVNALLFIIGALSVIMLIYGGIRYTISGGDSNAVTAAKNTIMYAIIGIVVAVLAYAIVNFVLTTLI
jgi:hypothetical protein